MESQSDVFDFTAHLAERQKSFLASRLEHAKQLGFSTVAELEAHEREDAEHANLVALAAEDARRVPLRRALACDAVAGRIIDPIRVQILHGEPLPRTKALVAVEGWLKSGTSTILVLSGGVGCGKTVASTVAMASARGSIQFLRAIRVGSHFERWTSDRLDKLAPIDMACGLMVIDDLGQEPAEDRRTMPALEEIVDSRQDSKFRTILTTNLTRTQIRDRYSERFVSRLTQSAHFAQIDEQDLRRAR